MTTSLKQIDKEGVNIIEKQSKQGKKKHTVDSQKAKRETKYKRKS